MPWTAKVTQPGRGCPAALAAASTCGSAPASDFAPAPLPADPVTLPARGDPGAASAGALQPGPARGCPGPSPRTRRELLPRRGAGWARWSMAVLPPPWPPRSTGLGRDQLLAPERPKPQPPLSQRWFLLPLRPLLNPGPLLRKGAIDEPVRQARRL